MNHAQFSLFIVYAFSVLFCGIGIYNFLDSNKKSFINKGILLGEVLLIGGIFLVGELLILSLIKLYRAPYLWGAVLINYAFLLNKNTRNTIFELCRKKISLDFSKIVFMILLFILIFRNLYFMVDVDSHSTYLFAQRLWISSGTSLIGNIGNDCRIFVPHFNAVPYSLGLSLFGEETLFPQLIDLFWRIIVMLLVFGYTSYRFNGYYGLAATMFVIFNDHFFSSGANQ